ncbi:RND transporter [Roseovarius sp. A21]|uniref:RND transporter n=1 Tax=Roseovarius bejariae TaxID=2576383 RepID=A0A844CRK3_9RHOB|nr:RND transporter [Roseovarius bejariae]MRU13896.1 RND transporter [Roseovarius bejariae]
MGGFIDRLPWWIVGFMVLTLGLAPYSPEPHIWEKLKMLVAGDLHRGLDWFDLILHSGPWALALTKGARAVSKS